jgi:hypothetical protein
VPTTEAPKFVNNGIASGASDKVFGGPDMRELTGRAHLDGASKAHVRTRRDYICPP